MDLPAREKFEQALRGRIVERIDAFLKQTKEGFTKPEGGRYDLGVAALEGSEPEMKKLILIRKLYNKLDEVSDPVMASYAWETEKSKAIPKSPKAYR